MELILIQARVGLISGGASQIAGTKWEGGRLYVAVYGGAAFFTVWEHQISLIHTKITNLLYN